MSTLPASILTHSMMMGARALGTMCLAMSRNPLAPIAREDEMYSERLTVKMAARHTRAVPDMKLMVIAKISWGMPSPRAATMAMAISVGGMAWNTSMTRMMTMSTPPPK